MSKPYPIVHEIAYCDPLQIFARWADEPGALLLESASMQASVGRYSFIAVAPFATYSYHAPAGECPLRALQHQLQQYPLATHPELPPFQGGAAGFFSYEFGRYVERVPMARGGQGLFPDAAIGFYDLVFAFDHLLEKAFIFSSGYPEQGEARLQHAHERLVWVQNPPVTAKQRRDFRSTPITSNFTPTAYATAVSRVIDYIFAGDIFEANLSQRFHTPISADFSAVELYQRLRQRNPAPFAAYVNLADTQIISASPERFLKVHNHQVETRPIKGTRKRGASPAEDAQLAAELCHSAKDHAENIMIVDLLRNDLSRVCEPDSVKVTQLCGLESYATVHHLVSVITGQLTPEHTAVDLLRVSFPGGSITGAPKIRAMEIIAELEPDVRGPYCGSIVYIGFDGSMDSSILIRSFVIKNQTLYFSAGGAVVADSDPQTEYEETLVKAHALQWALASMVE